MHYEWSLKPPFVDRNCDSFAQVDLNPASAVWHHGDEDGCDHSKMGLQGHPGTVTVTITVPPFSCTATFTGTETGDGPAAACVNERPAAPTHTLVSPTLIPHLVNTSEDPTLVYKRVMAACSKENLQTAKDGGLFAFIPYFKDAVKVTSGLKEKDTFVEVILGKVGLTKVGLGTAAFKKGFAVVAIVGDVSAITFNVAAVSKGRTGIPAEVSGLFGQFKLTPAELGPLQAQLLAPTTGSFVFPDFLATPQAAAKAEAAATGLRGFAAFLSDIATGKAR